MVGGPGALRAAIVGCGAISEEHLRFLAGSELAELVAVCDLSPALAEHVRARHGARSAYTDVDEMLSEVRPQIVHVLSPPRTHPDLIGRSLAAGAHVICEKPLAPSAPETEVLLERARMADRRLLESRNLLYNDVVRQLDGQIAAGRTGEIREVDVALALPLDIADLPDAGTGLPLGLAHDYLPHLAYLFLHFAEAGNAPCEVIGSVHNLGGRAAVGIDHVDVLVTKGKTRGRLRISPDVEPSSLRITVRGTRGSLEGDLYQPYVRHEGAFVGKKAPLGTVAEGAALAIAGVRNVRDRLLQHGTYHGMQRMLDDVYASIIEERPAPITDESMMASALLIDEIARVAGVVP